MASDDGEIEVKEAMLSRAAKEGNLDEIKTLLDGGADVRYVRPHGYDVLIDAIHGGMDFSDSRLISILQLLISHGANLNGVTDYSESALSVSSNRGRFGVVRFLLAAGADASPLQWTPLMHAIALGAMSDIEAQLKAGSDLSARDFWSRTPWLLSLQVGDVAKAKRLLAAGANRTDRGRCGKPPLMYSVIGRHKEMLQWLLSERFNPNETDDFQTTALMEAAELGDAESVRILIDAGADIHQQKRSDAAIKKASSLEIVNLLVKFGANLNEISDEIRALLTKQSLDGKPEVSSDIYWAGKLRRFGQSNPEKMDVPFWRAMVQCGACAYPAREQFNDTETWDEPVWCFR